MLILILFFFKLFVLCQDELEFDVLNSLVASIKNNLDSENSSVGKQVSCRRAEKRKCRGTCSAIRTKTCDQNRCSSNKDVHCEPFSWETKDIPETTTQFYDRGDLVPFSTAAPVVENNCLYMPRHDAFRCKNFRAKSIIEDMEKAKARVEMFRNSRPKLQIDYSLPNHWIINMTNVENTQDPVLRYIFAPCCNKVLSTSYGRAYDRSSLGLEASNIIITYRLARHCLMPLTPERFEFISKILKVLEVNFHTRVGIYFLEDIKHIFKQAKTVNARKERREFYRLLTRLASKLIAKEVWELNLIKTAQILDNVEDDSIQDLLTDVEIERINEEESISDQLNKIYIHDSEIKMLSRSRRNLQLYDIFES